VRTLVAALAVPLVMTGARAEPSRPLRVITYNVLHGGMGSSLRGDTQRLDERLGMAAARLRALDPDVVGLQEASIGRGRGDVAQRLGDALGFQHVFAPSRIPIGRWLTWLVAAVVGMAEGPALLSRWPIASSQAFMVARCGEVYERVLLCAVLATPWGPLDICSTHIDGSDCEAESLLGLVRDRAPGRPLVLMGDLNAAEDSSGMTRLVREGGFVDTFRRANPAAPGLTVWQEVHTERPMARRRVDYVLVRPGAGAGAAVVASRVALDTPGRAADGSVLWPSDHYAVLSEIELFGPGP